MKIEKEKNSKFINIDFYYDVLTNQLTNLCVNKSIN